MKHILREILNQVQDDGDAAETRSLKRFILVYRHGIVAKPDRVVIQVAGNICELVHKDSRSPVSPMARQRHFATSQRGGFVFLSIPEVSN